LLRSVRVKADISVGRRERTASATHDGEPSCVLLHLHYGCGLLNIAWVGVIARHRRDESRRFNEVLETFRVIERS
jgi:hypothetical protein